MRAGRKRPVLDIEWTIVDVIFKLCDVRGYSQTDLARRARIARNTLSAWKRGIKPNQATLEAIAAALNTTARDLHNAVPQSRPSQTDHIEGLLRTSDNPRDLHQLLRTWYDTAAHTDLRGELIDEVRALRRLLEERRPPNRSQEHPNSRKRSRRS